MAVPRSLMPPLGEVRGEAITAYKYRCGGCTRTAMVEANGVLVVKLRHGSATGNGTETHATSIPIHSLFKDYISRADLNAVREMERQVQKRLTQLLGLGAARAKPAVAAPRLL
jgi:hypothetical protein